MSRHKADFSGINLDFGQGLFFGVDLESSHQQKGGGET